MFGGNHHLNLRHQASKVLLSAATKSMAQYAHPFQIQSGMGQARSVQRACRQYFFSTIEEHGHVSLTSVQTNGRRVRVIELKQHGNRDNKQEVLHDSILLYTSITGSTCCIPLRSTIIPVLATNALGPTSNRPRRDSTTTLNVLFWLLLQISLL